MIRFGLRLAVASGREALTRLIIVAAAVALGVGLLLTVLAGMAAVHAQDSRYAWLQTGDRAETGTASGVDPAWWLTRLDYFDGHEIGRIDVAATGAHSPVPPGMPRLPAPGEFYVSPALAALLAATPADQLADRYPGHQVGTLGHAALPDPDMLLIVVGRTPAELSHAPDAHRVTRIETHVQGTQQQALELVLGVIGVALLFPVLIFIGAAARISAARREQRFAAMRLIGATPRQISVLAAVESTFAAAIGTAVGFGLFFLFHAPLARVPFTGTPFFPEDLALTVADVVLVAIGVPVAAAIVTRVALRRVRISPLGVVRRVTPRAPRAFRLIPALVGVAELGYFVDRRPGTVNGQLVAYLSGMLLILAGLVYAGPWLTMTGARVLARRSSRPATLIAARRLADDPKAGFRAISGLVLAVFVGTVATGVISTIVAYRGGQPPGTLARTVLTQVWWDDPARSAPPPVLDRVGTHLRTIPGVSDTLLVHRNPDHSAGQPIGLVACADLARVGTLGRCPVGASVAEVWPDVRGPDGPHGGGWQGPSTVWPAGPWSAADLAGLPVLSLVVPTDGSTSALEQARTYLETAFPDRRPPATGRDAGLGTAQTLAGWRRLAAVVIIVSLPIAGCSLAVNIAGGLSERRRPFSLLRLSGVPLRMLRRVVALESAVPLLVAAVLAVAVGVLAAALFLKAQMGYTIRPLGGVYYAAVVAGLLGSFAIIAGTLPMLRRITGPETARNE